MYLNNAKELYQKYPFSRAVACTKQEVHQIQDTLGLSLPLAFKEYLLWMGKGADLHEGSEFFSRVLFFLREDAEELILTRENPQKLPQDAIVFFMHGGNRFLFIRASEGDDPPVYFYGEGVTQFTKTSDHFSTYIENIINWFGKKAIEEDQKRKLSRHLTAQS